MMRKKPAAPINADPFMKPVPGWSLTQPPGKWSWDKPPQHVDADEAVDMIIDKLEVPETRDRYVKLMLAGVSVEEIVHSITMAGFMDGRFNPDLAELIKAPLAIYMMGIAEDENLPVKVFAKDPMQDKKSTMSDASLLELMRTRNPEFYDYLMTYEPEGDRKGREMKAKMSQGFMAVEEDEELLEDEEMVEMPEEDGEVEE